MITALDHLTEGRAVLGIGGAWFETEHTAFGIEFGSGSGERLDWLDGQWIRRLPEDVRVIGDKALFDLGLLGVEP